MASTDNNLSIKADNVLSSLELVRNMRMLTYFSRNETP